MDKSFGRGARVKLPYEAPALVDFEPADHTFGSRVCFPLLNGQRLCFSSDTRFTLSPWRALDERSLDGCWLCRIGPPPLVAHNP